MDPPFVSFNPFLPPPPPLPFHPQPQNPNPNANPIPIPSPFPSSDLAATISHLSSLISFTSSTLTSFSSLLPLRPSPSLSSCPFDPRHRMLPESLFRHSLLCPSAPGARLPDLSFLESLRYPSSFRSPVADDASAPFLRLDSGADLCLSLDGQLEAPWSGHGSFFYKDCPGIVTFPKGDGASRSFTLPAFLAAECVNFQGGAYVEKKEVGILPSEFWAVRCEVSSWNDFPMSYSYSVLRVASCLKMAETSDLGRWVIMNSPRFGVVIDSSMRDHVVLLLKLSLKAIEREAVGSMDLFLKKEGLLDLKSVKFECLRFVGSLNWLASQLSVLYGEVNGKLFAVGMVKESLLSVGSSLMLFKDGKEMVGEDGGRNELCVDFTTALREASKSRSAGNLEPGTNCAAVGRDQVFVSQVAAAVAALHERFVLEENIKMLRFGLPPPKIQIINEHSYISTRSREERSKRPDYKPVIEHDSFLWQHAQDQELGKQKTREELLAEERDYKRRRISYRGKKVSRTPTQVIREIIEEHMEGIRQVQGIECNVTVAPESNLPCLYSNSKNDTATGVCHPENGSKTIKTERDSVFYRKQQHCNSNSGMYSDCHNQDGFSLHQSHKKLQYEEGFKKSNFEREKNCGYRSTSGHTSSEHLHEQHAYRREHDNDEKHQNKYGKNDDGYFSRSKDRRTQSTLTLISSKNSSKEYDYSPNIRSRNKGRNSRTRRPESETQDVFEDRYDPSASYDEYDTANADIL